MIRLAPIVFGLYVVSLAEAQGAEGTASPNTAPGTTILGDQDAAVGLYLAPWKDEEPAELGRAPGLHDEAAAPVDAARFERAQTYYATGRAWRAERLQKNR